MKKNGETRISVWIGYVATLAIEVVLTRLLIALHSVLPLGQFPIYYVLVIMLVAYVFGEGPAILAFLVGLFMFDYFFVPPLHTVLPHPETPAAWASLLAYLVGTSIVGFAMVMIRRSQKRARRALAQANQEVAERKQAEEALRQSEQHYRSLHETMLQGVTWRDADGRIISMNPAALHILGRTVDEFLGRNPAEEEYETFHEDGTPFLATEHPAMAALQTRRDVTDVVMRVYNPADKGYRWININAVPLFHEGETEPYQVYTIFADITEQRKAEEALKTAMEELDVRAEKLQTMNEVLAASNAEIESYNVELRSSNDELLAEVERRKKAERLLEIARKAAEYGKSRMEAVLEALPVGLSILDSKGGVIMVNEAFDKVWGGHPTTKTVEDYESYRAWWVDTGKPVAPEEWAAAQAVQQGKTVIGQLVEIQRFDGTHGFALNSAAPIFDAEGKIIGSAVAIQDITHIREAEEAARAAEENKLQFYRRTIEAATSGKLTISEPAEIQRIAGPVEASWEIRSPDDIAVIRHGIRAIAEPLGLDGVRLGQLMVAVGEAATNAFKHAGQGKASIHGKEGVLTVVVSDKGPGIPALALPDVALTPGYSTAGTLGMGYKIMISFADKVYLATGAEGTAVGIQMRF